jgi:hypothetical protein
VGAYLTLQYLFAIEVFGTPTLFIGISVIIFMLVYPEHFKKLIRFSMNLSGAYVFYVILLSPFIYTAFIDRISTKPFNRFMAGKNLTGYRVGKKDPTLYLKYMLIVCTLILLFPNVSGGTAHTDTAPL